MNSREAKALRETMPFGYAIETGEILDFLEAKKKPDNLVPLRELTGAQKKELAVASWNRGHWEDVFVDDRKITKADAIAAVNEGSALGNDLVQVTMLGYEHIYDSLHPHDTEKYPLTRILSKSNLDVATSNVADTAPANFSIYNQLGVTASIYKQSTDGTFTYFGDIPSESRPETTTPDFVGQVWQARTSTETNAKILGGYMAYPGCTIWDVVSFGTDVFIPSAWNAKIDNIIITNKFKTYINICQVLINGALGGGTQGYEAFALLAPGQSTVAGPCYIGGSYVAVQGDTVIDEFLIDSENDTSWTLVPDTPPGGEEVYATGDNDYVFYQVNNPQDDTVAPMPKPFSKTIKISDHTELLYASFFDSADAYFARPQGATVSIESTGASGTKQYNTNTDTESLYIQMSPDGSSLLKLCVRNPEAGQWTITIMAMTNTPLCFQFQTVPTRDTYTTMQAALSPPEVLGSNWEDIAYSGFANIANTQHFVGDSDPDDVLIVWFAAVAAVALGLLVANQFRLGFTASAVRRDHASVDGATDTISDAAAPPPAGLQNILLVDADGADRGTKYLYNARYKYLYPTVESGKFRDNCSTLVGSGEATKANFATALAKNDLKFVSAAGHGNINRICGYTASGVSPWAPILETNDVNSRPALANGKIFHLLGCNTATGLGASLVTNGAVAYIGYDSPFEFYSSVLGIIRPDCEIDQALIDGKTVDEAVVIGKGSYSRRMNNEGLSPGAIGALRSNRDSLVVKGDGTATISTSDSSPFPPVFAIQTNSGSYLVVVNNGGLGGVKGVAITTNSQAVGSNEKLTVHPIDSTKGTFALKTPSGNYVTAVNGGDMGGPNDAASPIHTNATRIGPWEKLSVEQQDDGTYAFSTASGFYLTAVDGGGIGEPANVKPIHTNATKIGPWETFTIVSVDTE